MSPLITAGPVNLEAGWENYADGATPTNNPSNFNRRVYAGYPDAGSSNVELYWDYVQGANKATQFCLNISDGTMTQAYRVPAVPTAGTQKHRVDIKGLAINTSVTITIAAEFVAASGTVQKTAVSGWSFTPNYSTGSTLSATLVGSLDWAGGNTFENTSQYRTDTAPNGSFSNFSSPSIITNPNGSVDLVLQFQFTQNSMPATNFLVFYNATGAASQITDAAHSIDARSGTATYTVRILGINPTTYYSYAVAGYSVTKNGRSLTGLQAPGSWQNFRPAAAANYTGNIDSVAASTVKANAANGQTAFSETVQFRGDLPPTNAPTTTGSDISAQQLSNGSHQVTLNWNYTQGANIATHFAVFVKYGGGSISVSDPHFLVGANLRTIKLPTQLAPHTSYSFAIAALAVTKSGSTFNATLLGMLNSTLLNTDTVIGGKGLHIDVQPPYKFTIEADTDLLQPMVVKGSYDGGVDFYTDNGVFKPRIVVTAAYPPGAPSMDAREWIIFICTHATVSGIFFVYYDGTDRYYLGGNYVTNYFACGKNIF
ncbi:MAG: hypothetical protein JXA73_08845 [Acidobacteria bacterium]|nr:hypothetical protein [Acidobacteriota bacterium]